MLPSIALIGEYSPTFEPHIATNAAIAHSSAALGRDVASAWVSTADLDGSVFSNHQAIWIAPGSPYRSLERTLLAIRYARENGIPCFGTCGGFQHVLIEYARNVLGFRDAQHAEYDPNASDLFISRLECSLFGREMKLHFAADSLVARCYGTQQAVERYYCNFGVHPDKVAVLGSGDLRVVGSDSEGEIRVVELATHPFFIATLYVPQMRSAIGAPHPLITAFVRAAITGGS